MTKDYCEILLDSIRTVVDFETQKQKYNADHVEICTIIDNSGAQDEDIVYYWVQNESGQKYQVNSNLKNLRLGDQLYVQKLTDREGCFVLGRKLSEANLPISTIQAFERFFALEKFNGVESGNIYEISSIENYTRLSIECTVDSTRVALNTTGQIDIELLLNNGNIYKVSFSTTNMFGDPNNFYGTLQKKVFNISNLGDKIKQLHCFISDARFSDVNVYLGYDLDTLQEATSLHLYSKDSNEYKTDVNSNFDIGEDGKRTLAWRWIYEDENGKLQGLSSADIIPEGYNCHLYVYDENNDTGDMYGGLNWQEEDYKLGIILDSKKKENKYKLVITYNGTHIVSNEMVFINKQIEKPTAISNFKFKFSDNSNGQYPYYEYDGYLSEIYTHESLVDRTVFAQFNKQETASIEKIIWTVPIDLITITSVGGESTLLDDSKFPPIYEQKEVIEVEMLNTENADNYSLTYRIKENCHFLGENDQYLKCAIYVEGEEAPYTYEQLIVLRVDGTNGTDNYIVARFYDASYGLKHSIGQNETAYLEVSAYNGQGENITSDIANIKYNWIAQRQKIEYDEFGNIALDENGKELIDETLLIPDHSGENITSFEIKIHPNSSYLNLCPILHLDIKFTGENSDLPVLTKDIILPVRYSDEHCIYKGPSVIQYDYEGGNPKCARTSPVLLNANGEQIKDINWYLVTNDNFSGYPEFNQKTQRLDPRATYDSQFSILENGRRNVYLCNLIGYVGNASDAETGILRESDIQKVLWAQPILIIQNRYFSTIIDNWDGAMEINEEGNYILASAFAAGNKNEYNQFSGTMIGTFGTLIDADERSTETGIKGFKDGMQVYEFNDSGKATIGPSGSGQIQFDGWMGSIKSGGFDGKLDETANRVVYDTNEIGTQGSYWNLNTGELITNDGYFRGSLYADKLFIEDEVKEESGILSTARFETYADAEKAMFESEVDYLTHTDDTQTRANAIINSYVDGQQAINSMNASYSFQKNGVPTENYKVVWGEEGTALPPSIDYSRVYTDGGYTTSGGTGKILVRYNGIWKDYVILPEDVTGVKLSAFEDAGVNSNFVIYYQGNVPKKYHWDNNTSIQLVSLSPGLSGGGDYPRMEWIRDNKHQYQYDTKLWWLKEDKWYDDGDTYQNIISILDNRRFSSWKEDKRYRCNNFYTYLFRPISEASWSKNNQSSLPEQNIKYDPGIKNRILGEEYYSKSPTGVMINNKFWPIAENNDSVPQDFFRYCGGKYLSNKFEKDNEEFELDTTSLYYSYEYKAYYQYIAENTNNNFALGGRWIIVEIEETNLDPTIKENLGKWSPKKILKYNDRYYSYNFKANTWRPRVTKEYTSSEKLKGNNFNNAKSLVWLTSSTQAIVYFDAPIGYWKMFRIADSEKSNLRYTKYTSTINFSESEISRHEGPIKEINGLIQSAARDTGEEQKIVKYKQEYYMAALVDEENYNFYKLTGTPDENEDPEAEIETPLGGIPYIYNYKDRLCEYKEGNWDYSKKFDDSISLEDIKTYTVDDSLSWTGANAPSENIYHVFNTSHIYKVGERFYEWDEKYGWHEVKTAAATSASLVQWANASGAQSALTTQFVNGLNKTIEAVADFNPENSSNDKNKCYYNLSTGEYWVWNNKKWVIYEPSMSTSAQIKQLVNAAQAQIDITAKYDIEIKEVDAFPSEPDNAFAYYIKNFDITYIYLEEEEDYDAYVNIGYIFKTNNKWEGPNWYGIEGKLSRSFSTINQRTTGLESHMSLTVGYGDNADLTQKIIKNPAEFDAEYGNFSDNITLVYIRDKYPVSTLWSSIITDSGYYIYIKSPEKLVSCGTSLPASITINNEEIKIPKMAGISMAANAAGGSIDMLFGPGEGHILQLQENGDVYLKAKNISFDIGGTMVLSGNDNSLPLFSLRAAYTDTEGTKHSDYLALGGSIIKNGYTEGNKYHLAHWIGYELSGSAWIGPGGLNPNSKDQMVFAIVDYYNRNLLSGFTQNGMIYGENIYIKKVYADNAMFYKVIELRDATGQIVFKTNKNEESNTLIDNSIVRAPRLVCSSTTKSVDNDLNGFYIKNCAIDTACYINSTDTKIDDYFLKKNSLDVSDLDNKIGFNRFAYDGTGINGMVYYYALSEENITGSNAIGKVTYKGNSYYLVNDVSGSNRLPGYTKTAIQAPLFSDGFYYSISQLSGGNVQKITVFDWGNNGVFYRGDPYSDYLEVETYQEGSEVTIYDASYNIVWNSDIGRIAFVEKLLTEEDIGKYAYWGAPMAKTYYEKGTTFKKKFAASYTMGNSSVSIYPTN